MYKLVRPNGFDFYSETIDYAGSVGKIIRVSDYDSKSVGVCGKGLHASKKPNDCFIGAEIPCRAFKVKGIGKIAGDKIKCRYKALKIIEEINDLNKLFGWDYNQALNPINPLKIISPTITDKHIKTINQIASIRDSVRASIRDSVRASVRDSVRASVGDSVRASVWSSVWDSVGDSVRASVRDSVWASVRDSVRDSVGASVWDSVGASVWASVWDSVGASVGASVWAYLGSFFKIKKWLYINHIPWEYPFQPYVDLWKQGLIPSFAGKKWRLHGGENAKILWEEPI